MCECVRTEEKSLSVSVISSPSVVLFTPAKIENLSLTIIEGLCRHTHHIQYIHAHNNVET